MSLLTVLFLGFCSLIVICQLIPAVILFTGMVKALFVKQTEKEIKQ